MTQPPEYKLFMMSYPGVVQTFRTSVVLLLLFTASSCATYYHANFDFNREFENGDLRNALETLQRSSREASGKNRFIYHSNNGLLHAVLGNYNESNNAFEQAFLFGEDFRINYLSEAVSYLSNPNFAVYRGEDHEHLMVLYFKAINFLKMNKPEEALVECRRMNIRLNQLNDRYVSEEKFQRDAFVHSLMGVIYQSAGDYNNAFIAYRNALDAYESDYSRLFQMKVPEQLKYDLMNTAYWTGFTEEFEKYRERFQIAGYIPRKPEAELVFFWHNGLAPVKDEWGINFAVNKGSGDGVVFTNDGLGLAFPFEVKEEKDREGLAAIEVFRVAFPRYLERPLYFTEAALETNGSVYPLQLSEDINKIAFVSLRQRMLQEFAKGLLRAALKKATEHSLRKENQQLGSVVGLVNAITEKADTRSWQTLPHSIFYARVPLREGKNTVKFRIGNGEQNQYEFTYNPGKGQTLFHTFSSLESQPVQYRYY